MRSNWERAICSPLPSQASQCGFIWGVKFSWSLTHSDSNIRMVISTIRGFWRSSTWWDKSSDELDSSINHL